MTEHLVDRVMIFIDGSNLLRSWMEMYPGLNIDMIKLIDELTKKRRLIRPCFYGSIHPEKMEKEIRFHDFLQYNGFSTVIIPLRKRGTNYIEKGVDVALVTDMLSHAYNDAYDIAVLVSGDQDFHKAISRIKDLGKRVEIAYFSSGEIDKPNLCADMRKIADSFINICDIKEKIKR
jgi:uncharacterized LabA/DUF88 family protein